ncbi:T6SS phospholipase effector Tle1-like catalytic domain-containing protein [Lysobacter silvisoli]|nr:DUF2235 domain-containing protein [Lysobacter silvisoli]
MTDDKKKKGPDGVSTYPADAHDLASYEQASQALSQLSTPVLVRSSNPHERLFVAAFDGTGNSMLKDAPANHTNVADIVRQTAAANSRGLTNVRVEYMEGPGTQDGALKRGWDAATGNSYEDRVEEMYARFTAQSKRWLAEDPEAQIRVVSVGFSRGAEQAAGFTRLVDERGIQDPKGRVEDRDLFGNLKQVRYPEPALVPAHQVPQAVALFDPVGTGKPRDHDRRQPPSVLSGFQITAEDERRNLFKSTSILDPGATENGRFLNVTVGGAHSDIGGSYTLNGLSVRSGNLMVDYLNSLSDQPFLAKRAVPAAPEMNVVHRSEEHSRLYRTSDFDKDGQRDRMERLTPSKKVAHPNDNEPRDEAMNERFAHRPVAIGPVPAERPRLQDGPAPVVADTHALFERLGRAAVDGDVDGARAVGGSFLASEQGLSLQRRGGEQAQAAAPAEPERPRQQAEANDPTPPTQPPPGYEGPERRQTPRL